MTMTVSPNRRLQATVANLSLTEGGVGGVATPEVKGEAGWKTMG